MNKYYFIDNRKQQQGPYTIEELRDFKITYRTPVWCEGMSDWTDAGIVDELAPLFASTPSYQAIPDGNVDTKFKPDSWFALSVVSAFICCLPFSLVAMVYAAQVDALWVRGKYDEAVAAAKSARTWTIVSACVALLFWVSYVVIIAFGIAVSGTMGG